MKFDAKVMKTLPPGSYLTDPAYPGLRFVVGDKSKTFVYRYRHPVSDQLKQLKIGVWPALSIGGALVAWENLKKLRDSGEDPAGKREIKKQEKKVFIEKAKTAKLESYTVKRACDSYVELLSSTRQFKGVMEVDRMFRTMLGDFAKKTVVDVTRSQCFDLISSVALNAPVQASRLRTELAACWDCAIDSGRIPDTTVNYWRMILQGKIKSRGKKINGSNIGAVKRFLSPTETGQLINWLPNFSPLVADVLTLYFWSCCRGSEICAMRGDEITEENGQTWWTIPKSKTKNARHEQAHDLRVPLHGRALQIVQRRKEQHGDGFLFTTTGTKPILQKMVQTRVYFHQPYCETRPQLKRARCVVSHWAPHDLRRTSRTLLAALQCPSDIAESILGHMQPGIQNTYNQHGYDNERVEWLKRLSDHLESLASSAS